MVLKKVGHMDSKEGVMRWSRREITKLVCSEARQIGSESSMTPEFQSGEESVLKKEQRIQSHLR